MRSTLHRAFGYYPCSNRRVPHISLVFGEMWDTAGFPLKLVPGPTDLHGCPTFAQAYVGRKRWAKPSTAFRCACGLIYSGRSEPQPLSDCSPASLRLACCLADPVEIHSGSLDAVHPRHHCTQQRSCDQAVKQKPCAQGD
jgi:hypothetical protein